jgi:hypothetical protein
VTATTTVVRATETAASRGVSIVARLTTLVTALVALAALAAGATAASPFAWFHPAAAPAGWTRVAMPSGAATLAYPAGFRRVYGDLGSITAELTDASGVVIGYLNATPRQGNETLAGWPDFRVDHQHGEETAVLEEGRAFHLAFRGGTGSCVIDHYTTPQGHHVYREVACYVAGHGKASVLVAAAPPARWSTALGTELERAVSAYQAG